MMSRTHICLMMILCMTVACKEKVTQEQLIEAALAMKLDQWRQEKKEECRAQVLLEAETYVDSILVVFSLPTRLDTIPKPPKPFKPFKPPFREPPDSLKQN